MKWGYEIVLGESYNTIGLNQYQIVVEASTIFWSIQWAMENQL